MARTVMRRAGAALVLAATVVGVGGVGALAQDDGGSAITTNSGTIGVEGGDIVSLAPGVTISAGDVTNQTGIGVIIGGGTSAGSAPGGGTNAAASK